MDGAARRVAVRVEGVVQGVGFRPFVFRLAEQERLSGFVLNDSAGVLLEVEGTPERVDGFLGRLRTEAPPAAAIARVTVLPRRPEGTTSFAIAPSPVGGTAEVPVAIDTATCAACLAELADPADRRFRYPLLNCTDCGPRFSIVRGVPYDRPRTTMASFAMCAACQAEYDDPRDRRFHAQPTACHDCGPRVALVDADGGDLGAGADPIRAAAARLAAGEILAVKGIGGYHLACRADDADAVDALRARKRRAPKPFAVMVADLAAAEPLVVLGDGERALLSSPARPIVLAPRRESARVAAGVAPGVAELGVLLAYSGLHVLLLADLAAAGVGAPLVLTSANRADEPIAFQDDDALERLRSIADAFLLHDRPIHTRTDDSVVRVTHRAGGDRPFTLRRSRGAVPTALLLPVPARRDVLACGAEQKSTFCLARGPRAWIGHHIGDLEHAATHAAFASGIDHLQALLAVDPALVAHDLHPDYASTRHARARDDIDLLAVQHHHAHLAAALAEHGETGPAVGAVFDGTGLGADATIWGGELLVGSLTGCERAGHLWPVRLPGGAAAVREPWRMACAWLREAHGGEPGPVPGALAGEVGEREWRLVWQLAGDARLAPVTTSIGRLFDAVGALCGFGARAGYEGQVAIALEAACAAVAPEDGGYALPLLAGDDGRLRLDARETIRAVAGDLSRGVSPELVGARFHAAVARATVAAVARIARDRGLELAVLTGGVMQNRRLLEACIAGLEAEGLRVLVPEEVPANDGGISFGQAAIAAAVDAAAVDAAAVDAAAVDAAG